MLRWDHENIATFNKSLTIKFTLLIINLNENPIIIGLIETFFKSLLKLNFQLSFRLNFQFMN